jgi:RNA polymerase sigma factor (sigma-70 family)
MNGRVLQMRVNKPNTPEWTDEAVGYACGSGDPEAVAELFERFQGPLTRYFSRLLRADPEVEDLVQATFLEVARGRARFDGLSNVRTWLFGIATNVFRHHVRAAMRRRRFLRDWSLVRSETIIEQQSGITQAHRALERLRVALAALPETSRIAFVLCEIEGFSAREAGVVLNAREATIWKRVSDARKTLHTALEEIL